MHQLFYNLDKYILGGLVDILFCIRHAKYTSGFVITINSPYLTPQHANSWLK